MNDKESFEPFQPENAISNEQTTMFFNKYCEDPSLPSVANRMAESIVNFEIRKDIAFNVQDDFDLDDEAITEEEFLANVEAFLSSNSLTIFFFPNLQALSKQ